MSVYGMHSVNWTCNFRVFRGLWRLTAGVAIALSMFSMSAAAAGKEDCVLDGTCPMLGIIDAQGGALYSSMLGMEYQTGDFDEGGIPDSWDAALIAEALCNAAVPYHCAAVLAFNHNKAIALAEPSMAAYADFVGAMGSISTYWGGNFEDLAGLSDLQVVTFGKAYYELFSPTGDLDGDGATNFDEYLTITGLGLGRSDYVIAASTPEAGAGIVRYRMGEETEVLDEAFYGAGYWAGLGQAYQDGQTVAFWGVDSSNKSRIFLVQLGAPSSWRVLTQAPLSNPAHPIRWTPDGKYLIGMGRRISVETGEASGHYLQACATHKASDNFMVYQLPYGENTTADILAVPILPDGTPTGEPTQVTDFYRAEDQVGLWPAWFDVLPDGSAMVFEDYHSNFPQLDMASIYVLKNLPQIIAAPKRPGTNISTLAPTAASDPNLVAIRTAETPRGKVAFTPSFSADQSKIFFSEDWNDAFMLYAGYQTLGDCDFDIMISETDGTGHDIRLGQRSNQAFMTSVPGGSCLLYVRSVGGIMHLFATTLSTNTEIMGTLSGNALTVAATQQVSDVSGTTIEAPAGTIITFPPATSSPEIAISTPIGVGVDALLPEDIAGIPVARVFGPAGTVFSQPVPVTITYNDAQIEGLDEANLRVFLYNEATGEYDTEVTTIIARDILNNTITFTVDHFSTYGLGASEEPLTPAVPVAAWPLLLFFLAAGMLGLRRVSTRT